MLRSIETTELPVLQEYCRQLEEFQQAIGIPPASPLERHCIAFYQLAGAIGWRNTDCEYESYASAIIHWIVVMESLDLRIEHFMDRDLLSAPRLQLDYRQVLFHASRATQMLLYCKQAGKTERSKRYDAIQLEHDLGILCVRCLMAIPTDLRAKAFHDATTILERRV
jgi:hypothetical protein